MGPEASAGMAMGAEAGMIEPAVGAAVLIFFGVLSMLAAEASGG